MSTDFAPKPTVTSAGTPIPGQRLSVAGSAVKFGPFYALSGGNNNTNLVIVDVQGGDMYVTFDGRTPSATAGGQLYAGNSYAWNVATAQAAQFIQQSGAGTVDAQEYVSILGATQMPDVNVLKPKPLSGGAGAFTSLAVSGNETIGGTLNVTGAITPSQLAGIVGTTTNNNANAGSVGEIITASATAVGLSNGTGVNVTSVLLTAGDWDVHANVLVTPNGSTPTTQILAGISTISATLPVTSDSSYVAAFDFSTAEPISVNPGYKRVSIATSGTYFLVCVANFSTSTCAANGSITARRAR